MASELTKLDRLQDDARENGLAAVYLLGMGGSSLCAGVIRSVLGRAGGHPDLFVLDTTDERIITTAASRIALPRTWFVVASKSGTTIEVSSLERYSWSSAVAALGDAAGRHFTAITDPGTRSNSSRGRAVIATCSSTHPTSADVSRHCRCSLSYPLRSSALRNRNAGPRELYFVGAETGAGAGLASALEGTP
jgi:hypothetical protein